MTPDTDPPLKVERVASGATAGAGTPVQGAESTVRKAKPFVSHYARQFGTLAGLAGLCAVLWILTPHFLTFSNLINVAQQTSINAIIAVGLTFVIISGGIDLSVGSIVAFSGVVMGSLLQRDLPWPVAVMGGVAAGLGCGLINGVLITLGRLPPFIATLATLVGLRSLAHALCEYVNKQVTGSNGSRTGRRSCRRTR